MFILVREVQVKPSTRALRQGERRAQVLAAAEGLVARHGLGALTMDRLAGELGLSTGAIYRYFPGKDALLAGLVGAHLHDLDHTLEQAQAVGRGPLAALGFATRAYLRLAQERPERFGLWSQVLADPRVLILPDLQGPVWEQVVRVMSRLAGWFGEAAAEGALPEGDPIRRGFLYWTAIHGLVSSRKLARIPVLGAVDEPAIGELAGALLRGWGVDRGVWERAWEESGT
jgi:AcrR family transcriptional regulator